MGDSKTAFLLQLLNFIMGILRQLIEFRNGSSSTGDSTTDNTDKD